MLDQHPRRVADTSVILTAAAALAALLAVTRPAGANMKAIDYLPLELKNQWIYEDQSAQQVTACVSGTEMVNGIQTMAYRNSAGAPKA